MARDKKPLNAELMAQAAARKKESDERAERHRTFLNVFRRSRSKAISAHKRRLARWTRVASRYASLAVLATHQAGSVEADPELSGVIAQAVKDAFAYVVQKARDLADKDGNVGVSALEATIADVPMDRAEHEEIPDDEVVAGPSEPYDTTLDDAVFEYISNAEEAAIDEAMGVPLPVPDDGAVDDDDE